MVSFCSGLKESWENKLPYLTSNSSLFTGQWQNKNFNILLIDHLKYWHDFVPLTTQVYILMYFIAMK